MLSSLKSVVSDRGPTPAAASRRQPDSAARPAGSAAGALDDSFFDSPQSRIRRAAAEPAAPYRPRIKALKAQAQQRRDNLLVLVDRLAEGGRPSRRDSLDLVMALIEDAHAADPVLFGPAAADHFARLREARGGLDV